MRNTCFLGINHGESMRNAYFQKYFSYYITLYFNKLTNIYENMRNENKKSFAEVIRQFASSLILPGNPTTLHHHVIPWIRIDANGRGMMLPECGIRHDLFCCFPSVG